MDERIWLVVGLGNPGEQYRETRHNIGFRVVDRLAARLGVVSWQRRFDGEFARFDSARGTLMLLKPLTFMNLSGHSVRAAVHWYKLPLERLLVVHDDLDLPLGALRLRRGGSAAGHHGVESIIAALGSRDFVRLRIGIGRPPDRRQGAAYVLSPFHPEERPIVERVVELATEAILYWQSAGLDKAMNRFNSVRIEVLADEGKSQRE